MNQAGASYGLEFSEVMKGHVAPAAVDCPHGASVGERDGNVLTVQLNIQVTDVDRFISDPAHLAKATGTVTCDRLWGTGEVKEGTFNLFVEGPGPSHKRMTYRLHFGAGDGEYTLSGYKVIRDDPGFDLWSDTSTLYTTVYRGNVGPNDEGTATRYAAGIIRIHLGDFASQLASIKTYGPDPVGRAKAALSFTQFFLGALWEVYGPSMPFAKDQAPGSGGGAGPRVIPLYTLDGVKNAAVTVFPFTTADKIGLTLTRFLRAPSRNVVLIIHGLTTSTDMFIMPEHRNLVSFLLDNGYTDVWCLDYRMSNRFVYNLTRHRYNMDDIALYDYPAALEVLRSVVGARKIHVISHCLGAVSFTMSLFGKAVSGIQSAIANSAALTPRVPWWSFVKLHLAPFLTEYILGYPYLNPNWSKEPGLTFSKILVKLLAIGHPKCGVSACHMLSLMWGSGDPALYSHENLDPVTHGRSGDLYGGTSVHYYRHVRRMVRAGQAVKFNAKDPRYASLPDDYFKFASDIETPVLFTTGDRNHVFTDSNVKCFDRLEALVPGRHDRKIFNGYGHQDVFMGNNVHNDIFPSMIEFIRKHS